MQCFNEFDHACRISKCGLVPPLLCFITELGVISKPKNAIEDDAGQSSSQSKV